MFFYVLQNFRILSKGTLHASLLVPSANCNGGLKKTVFTDSPLSWEMKIFAIVPVVVLIACPKLALEFTVMQNTCILPF